MYATLRYQGGSGWTPEQAFWDMINVLTGEINIANLSANLDVANSFITSTIASDWELYDTVSANDVVLRRLVTDDATTYKYVRLWLSRTSSYNRIATRYYKTWNLSGNSGNYYYGFYQYSSSIREEMYQYFARHSTTCYDYTPVAYGTTMYISASAKHMAYTFKYNNDNNFSGHCFASEHTRDNLWDKPGRTINWMFNSYLPWDYYQFLINSTTYYYRQWHAWTQPEVSSGGTSVRIGSPQYNSNSYWNYHGLATVTGIMTGGYNNNTYHRYVNNTPYQLLDENGVYQRILAPFGAQGRYLAGNTGSEVGQMGGNISSQCGIYFTGAYGSWNDQINVGGKTYRLWPCVNEGGNNIYTGSSYLWHAVLEE